MKTTIVHDEQGQIVAIAKPVDLKAAGSRFTHATMKPQPGQHMLEIVLPAELEAMPLRDLHANYQVDRAASKLVKKV